MFKQNSSKSKVNIIKKMKSGLVIKYLVKKLMKVEQIGKNQLNN